MSEPEKKSGGSVTPGPLVVVEQTPATRHKPIHPTELLDEPAGVQRKHSRAPVVEPLPEESNSASQDKGSDCAISHDKPKQTVSKRFSSITNMSKKFSTITSKRGPSMDTIRLAPLDIETKREAPSSHQQPIPASVEIVASNSDNLLEVKQESTVEKKGDDDSITQEISDLRTSEAAKKHSEWSDDEEAGGLPRSESRASRASRASRMSRAVRQLLCCGVRYEAPSEDDISPRSGFATGI